MDSDPRRGSRKGGSLLSVEDTDLHPPAEERIGSPVAGSDRATAHSLPRKPYRTDTNETGGEAGETSAEQPSSPISRFLRWRSPDQAREKPDEENADIRQDQPAHAHIKSPEPAQDREPVVPVHGREISPRTEPVAHAAPEPDRGGAVWQPLIDPAIVFGEILRSRRLIVTCAIIGAVLGVAVALSTPRSYYASTEILIDPREWAVLDRDSNRGSMQADAAQAFIENQIRLLT
jgi:polysaccharide biosynthesis transport protein